MRGPVDVRHFGSTPEALDALRFAKYDPRFERSATSRHCAVHRGNARPNRADAERETWRIVPTQGRRSEFFAFAGRLFSMSSVRYASNQPRTRSQCAALPEAVVR